MTMPRRIRNRTFGDTKVGLAPCGAARWRGLLSALVAFMMLLVFTPAAAGAGMPDAAPADTNSSEDPAETSVGAPNPPNSAKAFTDVPARSFFGQGVAWLLDNDITQGQGGDGLFSPTNPVSRAQMAAFLWRMMGEPEAAETCGFDDIIAFPVQFYAEAACWLKAEGITTGVNEEGTRFAPQRPVTRGQMAQFLARLAGGEGPDTCRFTDPTGRLELDRAACWLADIGVTTGVGGSDRFAPLDVVNRGQMAAFLFRLAATPEQWRFDHLTPSVYPCSILDRSSCLLPFPNNQFTTPDDGTATGIKLNLSRTATPANKDGRRIDPFEVNRNDGFGPGQTLLVELPGVDLTQSGAAPIDDMGRSLAGDSPVVIINTETGERHPHWVEPDNISRDQGDGEFLTIIRPAVNFTEGTRYIVALRNLRDAQGEPVPAPFEFTLYRDNQSTDLAVIEDRRAAMNDLLAELVAEGLNRQDLYLAWDFTIASGRNLSERALHMRDDAFALLGNAHPPVIIDRVNDCDNRPALVCMVGFVDVPNYLERRGLPGEGLNWGANGLPQRNVETANTRATVRAPFQCVIPRSATPQNLARPSLYGHGLLGLSTEVLFAGADAAEENNMVFCAADWWGMSALDWGNVINILGDLSTFHTLPDRGQQGFINFMYLGRALKMGMTSVSLECGAGNTRCPGGNPFAAGGQSVIDTNELFFVGNSQGGIKGPALMALMQDAKRGVMGVPGMNYSTMLPRSSNWNTFKLIFDNAYPNLFEQPLSLGLIQMLWDRSEANGYAQHLTADPYRDTPEKTVLLFTAFGDFQVANVATGVMARTIGASVLTPALAADSRAGDDYTLWNLPGVEASSLDDEPFTDSALVMWDFGGAAPPKGIVPPGPGRDPHGVGSRVKRVRDLADAFLRTDGRLIDVCNGGPCAGED